MNAVFIRHAESFSNAGLPSSGGFACIPITANGEAQALALAEQLHRRPSLIAHSPFLRTQQTAAPTIARYPTVPVEVWPVQEFKNLDPARWDDTLPAERIPHVQNFWQRADPQYHNGGQSETFTDFLARAMQTLHRLEQMPESSLVYLFSHGYFINAIRSLVRHPLWNADEHMKHFVASFASSPILNVGHLEIERISSGWKIIEAI